jgi:hypothetical protein
VTLLNSNHLQLVLGSPVQSGLLSKFDKTETWTGPHKLTNLEKLDRTDINRSSAVLVGFLWLKDWSQLVSVSTVEDWLRTRLRAAGIGKHGCN